MPTDRVYDLHGVRLALDGPEAGGAGAAPSVTAATAAITAIRSRLARFPQAAGDPHLRFRLDAPGEPLPARPERGRTVYDPPAGEVLYDDSGEVLYLDGGGPRALCQAAAGTARLWAGAAPAAGRSTDDLWLLSHPLFTIPLAEMLKRRGLFALHAAGLCRDGRALLLPGTSGAGKSTLSLALAREGFGFLGDDTVFLARRPGRPPRVLAFPDEVDLTEESLAFFPEAAAATPASAPGRKRAIRAESVYGARIVWECEPGLLVFPRVAGRPESELLPMTREEALLELAPNVLLTDPAGSQAHLDALAELVGASSAWRLATGSDLAAAARLLRDLADAAHPVGEPA